MLDGALCMTRGEAQHARRLHAHNSPMSTWRTGYAEATIMSQTPSTTLPSTSWYMTLLSIAEIDRTWAEALLVIILQRTAALAGLPPQGVQCSAVRLPRSGCPPPSHPELHARYSALPYTPGATKSGSASQCLWTNLSTRPLGPPCTAHP